MADSKIGTDPLVSFWSLSPGESLEKLGSSSSGLSKEEAKRRLSQSGSNRLDAKNRNSGISLLVSQFKSPIILLLLSAAFLSFLVHASSDAFIILGIVLASGLLGFWQERGAANAVGKLLGMVRVKSLLLRSGEKVDIPVEDVVPGDILFLNAGNIIPADCLLLESKDLFVDEAAMTGETFPAEKVSESVSIDTPLSKRRNSLWMGTHVISGEAIAVVVHTGKQTEFGRISERLRVRPLENEFESGVRKFGFFLLHVTLILVLSIFLINVFLHRSVLESFLFSLALAVGLTPQLLPAIISVNLSHGARKMAEKKVIVKKLNAIENFGNMNIICSDKTGTLTEGTMKLHSVVDPEGDPDETAAKYAYLNASFETGFLNPIDQAIRRDLDFDIASYRKADEIPYDFLRKRLSILVSDSAGHTMITKGALAEILSVCSSSKNGKPEEWENKKIRILENYKGLSAQGFRVLGIAVKDTGAVSGIRKSDEENMIFAGMLSFFDPPKPHVADTVSELMALGVKLKVITGDNRYVAANLCSQIGVKDPRTLTGEELNRMSDDALVRQAGEIDVFSEIEPNSKERIIIALKKAGNVVGYIGDGINDASALHAADVGISVESAVDVAKNAADIVLLEKGLGVLVDGVKQGRVTFANTLKYVFMATSANFGNMFSMAGASLFLPFLPLLPKQILLTNFLTDFPEMTIAGDRVDEEMISSPRHWDIPSIRKFMLVFGFLSSLFDYITFGVLVCVLGSDPTQFRTGWFLESVISAALIVLVIRTRNPFFKSRPSSSLVITTFLVIGITLLFPYTPLGPVLGLSPLPIKFLGILLVVVIAYVFFSEIAKKFFYRRVRL